MTKKASPSQKCVFFLDDLHLARGWTEPGAVDLCTDWDSRVLETVRYAISQVCMYVFMYVYLFSICIVCGVILYMCICTKHIRYTCMYVCKNSLCRNSLLKDWST